MIVRDLPGPFFFLGPLLSHQPRRWIVDKCMFEELEELVDLYLNFNWAQKILSGYFFLFAHLF